MANTEIKYASLETLTSYDELIKEHISSEIDAAVSTKANSYHAHSIADVNGLQTTLDSIGESIEQKSQVQIAVSGALEHLPTLTIHKLTQEEYEQAQSNGTLENNVLYLTPDEEADLSNYATIEQLNAKADSNHLHDDVYYTETEIDALLEGKANKTHNHNDLYDTKGSANTAEQNAKKYVDELIANSTLKEHNHVAGDITDFSDAVNVLIENKNYSNLIESAKDEAIAAAAEDAATKANNALDTAKSYADNAASTVKSDLLNGAGAAYDTLKELGDLISENVDAIEALKIVAYSKADANHTHNDIYYTETEMDNKISTINTSIINSLSEAKTYTDNAVTQMSSVQIITWEADD